MKKLILLTVGSALTLTMSTSVFANTTSSSSQINIDVSHILSLYGYSISSNADFSSMVTKVTDTNTNTNTSNTYTVVPYVINGNYRVINGYMHIDDALTKYSGVYVDSVQEGDKVLVRIPNYYDAGSIRYITNNGAKYLNLSELGRYYGTYKENYYRDTNSYGSNPDKYIDVAELNESYPEIKTSLKDYDEMYLSIDGYAEVDEADYYIADSVTYVDLEDIQDFYSEYQLTLNTGSGNISNNNNTNNNIVSIPSDYISLDKAKSTYSEIIDYKKASNKEMYPVYKGNIPYYDEEIEYLESHGVVYLDSDDIKDAVEEYYEEVLGLDK